MSTPASGEPTRPNDPNQGLEPGRPGQFPEIAPGVPRYGQYAPPGYQSPFEQEQQEQRAQQAATGQQKPSQTAGFPTPQPEQLNPAGSQPARVVPRQITSAFGLILLAGALALFAAISSIFLYNSAELRAMLLKQLDGYPQLSSADIDVSSIITASIVMAIVIGFIGVALYVLIAFKIRAGKNWARVLGTVLAAISLVSLFGLNPITILQVGFGVFGIIYCWLPANRDYFKR